MDMIPPFKIESEEFTIILFHIWAFNRCMSFDCRFNVVHFTRVTNEIILLRDKILFSWEQIQVDINELNTPLYRIE